MARTVTPTGCMVFRTPDASPESLDVTSDSRAEGVSDRTPSLARGQAFQGSRPARRPIGRRDRPLHELRQSHQRLQRAHQLCVGRCSHELTKGGPVPPYGQSPVIAGKGFRSKGVADQALCGGELPAHGRHPRHNRTIDEIFRSGKWDTKTSYSIPGSISVREVQGRSGMVGIYRAATGPAPVAALGP